MNLTESDRRALRAHISDLIITAAGLSRQLDKERPELEKVLLLSRDLDDAAFQIEGRIRYGTPVPEQPGGGA